PRAIVCGVLKLLSKLIVSAPWVAFAWPTAQRREPGLRSSSVLRTVKVDGQQRSSSASRARQTRRGALRIVRVAGRVNNFRIQKRSVMADSPGINPTREINRAGR